MTYHHADGFFLLDLSPPLNQLSILHMNLYHFLCIQHSRNISLVAKPFITKNIG